MSEFRPPRPIAGTDEVDVFDCGEVSLNAWLSRSALMNEKTGASRTLVSTVTETNRVAGFYCLSASTLVRSKARGSLSPNMPDPIPVVLLGRLAVDREFAGKGLGTSLLQHAVIQAVRAAEVIGARAMIVHTLSDSAIRFYEKFGFSRFPGAANTMYLRVADAVVMLAGLAPQNLAPEARAQDPIHHP